MAAALPFMEDDFKDPADALALLSGTPELAESLAADLETYLPALRKLLETPPKNDESRRKMKAGEVELEGDDGAFYDRWSFEDPFIQQVIQLADDLNLDELVTTQLVWRGKKEADAYDRNAAQTALILYHQRRKNILDCVRLILEFAVDENGPAELRVPMLALANAMILPHPSNGSRAESFVERCIASMAGVRQSVQLLRDKERHAETLRIEPPPGWKDDLVLQMQFLQNQHEMLANIIYDLIKIKEHLTLNDFRALMKAAKGFDHYDIYTAHHLLPLMAYTNALCAADSPLKFEDAINFHFELLEEYKERPWPLRHLQAALLICWISEFNGVCNDPPDTNSPSVHKLDYHTHIFTPGKNALQDGAFEFLLAISADVNTSVTGLNSAREDLHRFLQQRVWPLEDAIAILPDTRRHLIQQLETFVENFIGNMADMLKIIKTREEEDVLMDRKDFDYELERFFLIIHYVYTGRPDSALAFWQDTESNLFGFLAWGCARQTPFVEATFSYMLSSLAYGPECAAKAHQFLLDELTPGSLKNRRGSYLCWDHIIKQFQAYYNLLEPKDRKQNTLVPVHTPYYAPPQPPPGVDAQPEMSMILAAHMRLVAQLARDSDDTRLYLLNHQTFHLLTMLFDLLALGISVWLWDSVFTAIAALLTDKSGRINSEVWTALDKWIVSNPRALLSPNPSNLATSIVYNPPGAAMPLPPDDTNVSAITHTAHPAEAFVLLLSSLVELPRQESLLKDALPFPESLGSSYRPSGIDPFVDFLLGNIFASTNFQSLPPSKPRPSDRQEDNNERLGRVQYKKFRPALQLSSLQFMRTCLTNFNEDLFNMALKKFPVDDGVRCSSLKAYAILHPCGRVMEHLHTEKVIKVIFEIIGLGVDELHGGAEPASPAARTVYLALEVLNLALRLESTYTQILRPQAKQAEGTRRSSVSGHGYNTLADAILSHLEVVIHLGQYVEVSQPEIVLLALDLLEKINTTPQLVSPGLAYGAHRPHNRVLAQVESSPEARQVVFGFIHKWDEIPRMEGEGLLDPRLTYKLPILRFLESSLDSDPTQYNLAHMLLGFGFDTKDKVLPSSAPGGIATGVALLHCIISTVLDSTEFVESAIDGDVCRLRNACFSVLKRLWRSPATSSEIADILRKNSFLAESFVAECLVDSATDWDGISVGLVHSPSTTAYIAFSSLLKRRSALFEYAALEIRRMRSINATSVLEKYLSTLLGETEFPDSRVPNVKVLELLDFLELELRQNASLPETQHINTSVLDFFIDDSEGFPTYDLEQVGAAFLLQQNILTSGTPELTDPITAEREVVLAYLELDNEQQLCRSSRRECLKAWCTLVIVMLGDCEWDQGEKIKFILQALQAVTPKLEAFIRDEPDSALELSSLTQALVSHLDFEPALVGADSDTASHQLYQLFRLSIQSIQSPLSTMALREDFYNIALRYMNGVSAATAETETSKRISDTVKSYGERLISVICSDAYEGHGNCKVVALLLLEELVAVTVREGNHYITNAVAAQNFMVLLVKSIETIARDLRAAKKEEIPLLLNTFRATTSFLLRVSQHRRGADHVLAAGLFQSLHACELFKTDPDLGLNIDGLPLSAYHELLLDVVRIVVSCIVVKGPQNTVVLNHCRKFLAEIRTVAVAIFKRRERIGLPPRTKQEEEDPAAVKQQRVIAELADTFVLLFAATEFVESEQRAVGF